MSDHEPEWIDCTVPQWEKKCELSQLNGEMGRAILYADYANARDMYDDGMSVEEVEERWDPSVPMEYDPDD